jgi:hypothetical protein
MILAFSNDPTANPDIRYIVLVRFNRKNKNSRAAKLVL